MSKLGRWNSGYHWVMLTIDVFSKKLSCQLLKKKTGREAKAASETAMSELEEPTKIQVDEGREFMNKDVKQLMKEKHVVLFSTENSEINCAMAENAIQTLKGRIYRLIRARKTQKHHDAFPALVQSYNSTTHRAHSLKPDDVSESNSLLVFNNLFHELLQEKKQKVRFRVGENVRISVESNVLKKGYEGGFKKEIFKITRVVKQKPRTLYGVSDLDGNLVLGQFYEPELSRV